MSFLSCIASPIPATSGTSVVSHRGCTVCVLGAKGRHQVGTGRKCCQPSLWASKGHGDEEWWAGQEEGGEAVATQWLPIQMDGLLLRPQEPPAP